MKVHFSKLLCVMLTLAMLLTSVSFAAPMAVNVESAVEVEAAEETSEIAALAAETNTATYLTNVDTSELGGLVYYEDFQDYDIGHVFTQQTTDPRYSLEMDNLYNSVLSSLIPRLGPAGFTKKDNIAMEVVADPLNADNNVLKVTYEDASNAWGNLTIYPFGENTTSLDIKVDGTFTSVAECLSSSTAAPTRFYTQMRYHAGNTTTMSNVNESTQTISSTAWRATVGKFENSSAETGNHLHRIDFPINGNKYEIYLDNISLYFDAPEAEAVPVPKYLGNTTLDGSTLGELVYFDDFESYDVGVLSLQSNQYYTKMDYYDTSIISGLNPLLGPLGLSSSNAADLTFSIVEKTETDGTKNKVLAIAYSGTTNTLKQFSIYPFGTGSGINVDGTFTSVMDVAIGGGTVTNFYQRMRWNLNGSLSQTDSSKKNPTAAWITHTDSLVNTPSTDSKCFQRIDCPATYNAGTIYLDNISLYFDAPEAPPVPEYLGDTTLDGSALGDLVYYDDFEDYKQGTQLTLGIALDYSNTGLTLDAVASAEAGSSPAVNAMIKSNSGTNTIDGTTFTIVADPSNSDNNVLKVTYSGGTASLVQFGIYPFGDSKYYLNEDVDITSVMDVRVPTTSSATGVEHRQVYYGLREGNMSHWYAYQTNTSTDISTDAWNTNLIRTENYSGVSTTEKESRRHNRINPVIYGEAGEEISLYFDNISLYIAPAKINKVTFNDGDDATTDTVLEIRGETIPEADIPEVTKDDYVFFGWSLTDGGEVVDVAQHKLTGDTTFYAVCKSHDAYKPEYAGTEIRTNVDPETDTNGMGMRVIAEISQVLRAEIDEYEMGFIVTRKYLLDNYSLGAIAPEDFTESCGVAYVPGVCYRQVEGGADNVDRLWIAYEGSEYDAFTGLIVGIPLAQYEDALVFRPYIKFTQNGESKTVYGEPQTKVVLDILDVMFDSGNEEESAKAGELIDNYEALRA